MNDRPHPSLAPLLSRIIIETPGELLLKVMQAGTVSTNVFLRRLHNFYVDMNWLPWPVVPASPGWQCYAWSERAIVFAS